MRLHFVILLAFLFSPAAIASADELRFEAKDLFARSVTTNLRPSPDGNHVELDEGDLIEDDGPAAGYSYLPNEERLSDKVWIRKELIIPNPAARKATLLVGSGGDLKSLINGKPIELKNSAKAGNYWQAYAIPPDCLIAGKNEIVLYGAGKVWIARAEDFHSTIRIGPPCVSFVPTQLKRSVVSNAFPLSLPVMEYSTQTPSSGSEYSRAGYSCVQAKEDDSHAIRTASSSTRCCIDAPHKRKWIIEVYPA